MQRNIAASSNLCAISFSPGAATSVMKLVVRGQMTEVSKGSWGRLVHQLRFTKEQPETVLEAAKVLQGWHFINPLS